MPPWAGGTGRGPGRDIRAGDFPAASVRVWEPWAMCSVPAHTSALLALHRDKALLWRSQEWPHMLSSVPGRPGEDFVAQKNRVVLNWHKEVI